MLRALLQNNKKNSITLFMSIDEGDKMNVVPVFVVTPGTSCRQQILDGTGVRAVHPIEILFKQLTRMHF